MVIPADIFGRGDRTFDAAYSTNAQGCAIAHPTGPFFAEMLKEAQMMNCSLRRHSLVGAALFGALAFLPANALADTGLKTYPWRVSNAPRLLTLHTERQKISYAWAEIQALRAFVRMP